METSKKRVKTFCCEACGYTSPKWLGQCPLCKEWNTLVEGHTYHEVESLRGELKKISSIQLDGEKRLSTGFRELDRVLGGGVVRGSLILVGGTPGIGKSTLLLQISEELSNNCGEVLYVSGEESAPQIKTRAERIGVKSENLYILTETNLTYIQNYVEEIHPSTLIIDSIQTMHTPEIQSPQGSITQVRGCTTHLMHMAKTHSLPIFIVSHVTKEGVIAGPKVLEHIVDTVLYFEGEEHHSYRILRAVKNRFGSTNEIGVFEMSEKGLQEVVNPSKTFLEERLIGVAGSVVIASIEGTRPILLEIQSLVTKSFYGVAKRETVGVEYGRVSLLVAVLERKIGLRLWEWDLFVNVAGGVKVAEPAADLGIALSILSSYKDTPIDPRSIVFGEVGLAGEVRAVNKVKERVTEAERLGFKRCIVPKRNATELNGFKIEVVGVGTIEEAAKLLNDGDREAQI